MRDWLPKETLLRQKLIRLIEHHYQLYGFQPIDTPALENIEVLQGKGGGENEKLMFEVIRRREDFYDAFGQIYFSKVSSTGARHASMNQLDVEEMARFREQLADLGLRFDLTVPLARYYANHSNDLPKPFRCYHIGPVWRADRPQKGRYREFYQCDIDIVGGASDSYEVELLLATDRVLKALNVGEFTIRISDKRLLSILLKGFGVKESEIQAVAIAIDKLDKKSPQEVLKDIEDSGISVESYKNVKTLLVDVSSNDINDLRKYVKASDSINYEEFNGIVSGVEKICARVMEVNQNARIVFDHLLVRGFDYYTGPVFEINVEDKDFNFSIGGGGRYDGLIEKLGGPKGTPAVGISLGFERILLILAEKEKSVTQTIYPRVFIANNGQPEKDILSLAEQLRSEGIQVEACLEKKDFKKQMETAQANGIDYAITDFKPGAKSYKVRQLSTRQDKAMPLAELYDIMKRLSEEIED